MFILFMFQSLEFYKTPLNFLKIILGPIILHLGP
jgi:hypothetical protein